jgi:putative endonuclease
MKQKDLGELGELAAVHALEAKGYEIRVRNWRVVEGEVDIISETGGTIVFVEVKTRRNRKYGYPEEAITRKKRARLIKAAQMYLDENNLQDVDWRFDLVAIECYQNGDIARMDHLEDIIQAEPGEFF